MQGFALTEAEVLALERNDLAALFEAAARTSGRPRAAFNWVTGEVARKLNDLGPAFDPARIPAAALADLIRLVEEGTISASIAKTVFERIYETGRAAGEIVRAEGLGQIGDEGALRASVAAVLEANRDAVAQYRGGKAGALGFLVGQVMKATGGKANPKLVNELLQREIEKVGA